MRKSSLSPYLLAFFLVAEWCCISTAFGQAHPADRPDSSGVPNAGHPRRPLLDVLVELNKTKGVYFLFSQQPLGKVLVNSPILSPDLSTEKILGQVLKNTGLHFKKIDPRTFVILNKSTRDRNNSYDPPAGMPGLSGEDSSAAATNNTLNNITGKVTARDGKILQGVSVTVKGTGKGTTTDSVGVFDIPVNKEDVLVFSFVGYKMQEIPAGQAGQAGIVMQPSDQPLTEVLVTALGITRPERTLGYSASELDGSLFTQSREVNIGNALIGQVAGVSVTENATGPYGSSRVLIRGNASLSGNNQPLYVIDGVPYDNTNQGYAGQWGGTDLGDGLSNISPDDIESIVVLKGVAASALYGYRGGNGAILVTTRSGSRAHDIGVELNNNFTLNSVIDDRDYQYVYGQGISSLKPANAASALTSSFYSWGAKLDGSTAVNYLGNNYAYSPEKNNFQHFFRTGLTDQSSVALTGANDKGHFRLGLSDLYLGTVIPNSNMQQQALNFNSAYTITPRLQMNLKANYIFEQVKNRASFSDEPGNILMAPLYLANSFDIRWMKDHTMHPDGTEWLPGNDLYFENPYYIAYEYQNKTERNRLTGGLTVKYNLLDWLYLQGQVTRDGYIFDVTNITPSGVEYTRSDGIHGGNLTQYEVNYHEVNSSFMAGFHKKAGPLFSLEAQLGGNRQDNVTNIGGVGALPNSTNIAVGPFIIPGYYDAANIAVKPYNTYYKHYRVNSIYGSVDISFKNYLFLTATARNDWFSTLDIHTDQFLYPSVSAGFIFTDAWRLPSWISFGKLRASYAQSSNGTQPYQNTLTYGLRGYPVSGQPLGYVATGGLIPDTNLRPVNISEKELGLYLQCWQNRLSIDATVYDKRTTNDIVNVTVSPTSGYNQQVENIGKVRNRGIELSLTGTPWKTRDFTWDLAVNFALNDSRVLYLGGAHSIVIAGAYPRWGSEVSVSNVVGMPYGQIMGYAYKKNDKGQVIFNSSGEPVQSDKVVPLGSGVYRQTGGVRTQFRYRNLSLAVLFDFKYGAKIYSGTNLLLYYYGLQKATLQGRESGYTGQGVNEAGGVNTVSVAAQDYFQDISARGTDHIAEEFVYDASFIKLRAATVSYSFSPRLLANSPVKGLTVSLVGRNLATLMKHTPNIDPESSLNNTNGQGLELSGYPAARSIGLNVNVRF